MSKFTLGVLVAFYGLTAANAAAATIRNDLSSCTQATGLESVDACNRVMASGRLPGKQRYIAHYNRG